MTSMTSQTHEKPRPRLHSRMRAGRRAALLLLVIASWCAGAAPVRAQGPLSFGVQASWCDDADFGLGARAIIATSDWVAQTRVVASFDYFFPGSTEQEFPGVGTVTAEPSFWEFNLNGHYVFTMVNAPFNLYAGTGLHLYDGSVEVTGADVDVRGFDPDGSGVGLNLLGGAEFPLESTLTPFAELKVELGGAEQVVLTGGMRF